MVGNCEVKKTFGFCMKFVRYAPIFWQLLKTEFTIFRETFFDKLLNSFIWTSTTVAVTSYILPVFGLSVEYGALLVAGVVVGSAFSEAYPQVSNFIADLEDEQHINYLLTLPLPGWLLMVKCAFVCAFNAFIMGVFTLMSSKLILFNRFSLENISIGKLIVAFFGYGLFFGFFTFFMISLIKSMHTMENTFMRIMYPLWFLGGFQFSWTAMHSFSPALGYVLLLDPYIYAMEGMRGAILGQSGFLPFWLCMPLLFGFTLLFGWWGIVRLKKRLDFV